MHDTKYKIIKEVEVLSRSASGRVKVAAAALFRSDIIVRNGGGLRRRRTLTSSPSVASGMPSVLRPPRGAFKPLPPSGAFGRVLRKESCRKSSLLYQLH